MLQIPITQEDFDKMYKAADILERQQLRPRARVSVNDLIRESALERAELILTSKNKANVGGM